MIFYNFFINILQPSQEMSLFRTSYCAQSFYMSHATHMVHEKEHSYKKAFNSCRRKQVMPGLKNV